jgi:hypothetical protein
MPPLPPSPTSSPGDRPASLAVAAAADAARGASPRASASPPSATLASASSLAPAPADWAWLPAASVPEWEHILGTASRARSSGGGSGNGGSPAGGGFSLSSGGGGGDAVGDGAPWPLRLRIVHEWRAAPGGGLGSGSRGSSGTVGGSSRPLRALVPSSDEAFAVAVASTVRVWHLGGPTCVAEYAQHAGAPTAAALLPTRLFASAGASSSAAGLGLFASAELHAALVVSGDATGALHVWRAASGERIAVLQDASGSSSGSGGTSSSFSASSSPSSSALSPAASPTAAAAAAASGASGASAAVSASSDDAAVTCVRALDGGWGGRVVAGLQDGRLRFADASAGRALHAWRVAPPGSEAGGAPAVRSLALCPGAAAPTQPLSAEPPSGAGDGAAYIAAGLSSGVITLLDARAGGVVRPFRCLFVPVRALFRRCAVLTLCCASRARVACLAPRRWPPGARTRAA